MMKINYFTFLNTINITLLFLNVYFTYRNWKSMRSIKKIGDETHELLDSAERIRTEYLCKSSLVKDVLQHLIDEQKRRIENEENKNVL